MKDFLTSLFIKNWQYKLAALLTAAAIWFYVVSEQNLSIVQTVPLELSNYPSDMKITNKVRTSVDIFLEGRRDIINKMEKAKIRVQLNLKEAKEGRNNYIITASRISNIPRGVAIIDISPARLTIIFEKKDGENKGEKTEESSKKKTGS